MIPVFRPSIGDEEIQAVTEVLRSGWLGLGPKTAEFEKAFAKYVGARHAIGLNSGTAALHLALAALDIGPGDEVLVPTITFVSTPHVVEYLGARAVFVDVDPHTLCMDVDDAERKITERTKAICPVHYGGRPCDLGRLRTICERRGLFLVEDAAHASGASYQGDKIGALARPFVCFSFHAVKNLTCGEGGMITTDDDQLAARIRELRWMGITRDTWNRTQKAQVYAWQYWVRSLGYKAHLSDIAAALGIVQLKRLDELNARREELVACYRRELEDLDWVTLPQSVRAGDRSSWHIFHIAVERRDDLIAHLKEHEIAPGVHYYPCHMHPYYEGREHACPVAEDAWQSILTLPLFPDLAEEQVAEICDAIRAFGRTMAWKQSVLESADCVLREVRSTDLEQMRAWRNQPEARRWFFHQDEITEEMQIAWFNRYLKNDRDLLYLIETKDGRSVGTIGLDHIDRGQGTAELGRMLIGDLDARRHGFGRRAVEILLHYAFDRIGLHRVFLEVQEDNQPARALYTACGFQEEGILRAAYVADGVRRNKVLMAAIR